MILEEFGVQLHRITEDDIEIVREWRNSDYVKKNMVFTTNISAGDQQKWFKRINNRHNFYFIIHYKGTKIGCANIKDIDYTMKTGVPGIFIGDQKFLLSPIAVVAVYLILKFAFFSLGLEYLSSPVITKNIGAIKLYQSMGFEFTDQVDGIQIANSFCYRQKFILKKERVERAFNLVFQDKC